MKRATTMDKTEDVPNKVALVERNIVPQGVPLVDPSAVAKSSKKDLVALAKEIQKADEFIKANASNKLEMIAQQMRFLEKQAENVLLEAQQNAKLHHVACNFVKKPGNVYHLYERESGQLYFSMLSPEEWGSSGPSQTFKGSFRLEHDHSWTPVSQVNVKDSEMAVLNKLLSGNVTSHLSFRNLDLNIEL